MDRLDFIVPVRLVPEPGEPVTEIYSIDEALTFLQNCSEDRHGRVHQMALDYCLDAKVNLHTTEDARRALAGFAGSRVSRPADTPEAVRMGFDGDLTVRC